MTNALSGRAVAGGKHRPRAPGGAAPAGGPRRGPGRDPRQIHVSLCGIRAAIGEESRDAACFGAG